jgi:prepilin-type N-terminal cleavage/methylation domain-containing protein
VSAVASVGGPLVTETRQVGRGFTLIELLVVIAIVAILAAILFPVFIQAKAKAKQAACMSNLKQIGTAFVLYMTDNDDVLPDRRDLKLSLPGGYKPWTTWPTSDPRAGWVGVTMGPYLKSDEVLKCPGTEASPLGAVVQVVQEFGTKTPRSKTNFWMWRFDRPDDPIPLDDLWGKSEEGAVSDLQAANNPQVGFPEGTADVEMAVDPYFPKTIPTVPPELKGKSVHFGGRNRLFLDWHVKFLKDARTD